MSSAIKISPELREALQAYLDWVNVGAPDLEPFDRRVGLCHNLVYNYDQKYNLYYLVVELGELFITTGLDEDYPFGELDYAQNCRTSSQHLHAARIEWIKTVLETNNE